MTSISKEFIKLDTYRKKIPTNHMEIDSEIKLQ
jgi:hypothetical protein